MSVKNLFFILPAFIVLITSMASAGEERIAVLELFTTQGCSDSIPADEVFRKTIDNYKDFNGEIIALGCHVTYLNKEGDLNSLSQSFCDTRLSNYMISGVLKGAGVPQAIINGKFNMTGNQEDIVVSGIKMAHSIPEIEPVQMELRDGNLDITLPEIRAEYPIDVWIFGYDRRSYVNMLGNKNTIGHYNVVKHLSKILSWDGSYKNISYSLKEMPADSYAVIAQYADAKNIIAAGKIESDIGMMSITPGSESNSESSSDSNSDDPDQL